MVHGNIYGELCIMCTNISCNAATEYFIVSGSAVLYVPFMFWTTVS